ncbi:hypothetical protein ACFPL7_22715 [Dongia soli]|uniref:Methylaspartate ammonia-lyase n=1 Tax=Dongia soli TaxID=600628 RepID=A0ABU5E8P6_9PROT|nr:hypothetical protein [Dongia soli]MDY0882405.1 hypothetical protein [Dongia soli]
MTRRCRYFGGLPLFLALVLLLTASRSQPAAADAVVDGPACAVLARTMAAQPDGPVLLASFPSVTTGPLHNAAFLYDNAVAAIALLGCGRGDQARRIGDAMLLALEHDRYWHDGRLRNGYAAGPVTTEPIKLAGWWDQKEQRWLEDRYQAGSDSGNLAWAMLALLSLARHEHDTRYRGGAERIAHWLITQRDTTHRIGGFTGGTFGHEPTPSTVTWKSTEHNTDLAAAFAELAMMTGNAPWQDQAHAASQFVSAMWDNACACFATGTGDDGVSINRFLALDAQVWPLLALPGLESRADAVMAIIAARLAVGDGYAYSEVKSGIWTEGTAQVALLVALHGDETKAAALLKAIARQRASDGSYYASDIAALPTGFMLPTDPRQPRLYFRLPHLGATAWVALAERRFNPFTGSATFP